MSIIAHHDFIFYSFQRLKMSPNCCCRGKKQNTTVPEKMEQMTWGIYSSASSRYQPHVWGVQRRRRRWTSTRSQLMHNAAALAAGGVCHMDWPSCRPSQMVRTLPGSQRADGGPAVTQIHFKRLALGEADGQTPAVWRERGGERERERGRGRHEDPVGRITSLCPCAHYVTEREREIERERFLLPATQAFNLWRRNVRLEDQNLWRAKDRKKWFCYRTKEEV